MVKDVTELTTPYERYQLGNIAASLTEGEDTEPVEIWLENHMVRIYKIEAGALIPTSESETDGLTADDASTLEQAPNPVQTSTPVQSASVKPQAKSKS